MIAPLKLQPPYKPRKRPPNMPAGPPRIGARRPKPSKSPTMAPAAKQYAARARRGYPQVTS